MVSWAPIYSEKWCDLTWPCICLKFNFHQARKISTGFNPILGGGGGEKCTKPGGGAGFNPILGGGKNYHILWEWTPRSTPMKN